MKEKIRNLLKIIVKGYLRDLYWDVYGQTINNPSWSEKGGSIIFVCKGNICRSPFAHYLAQKILNDRSNSKKAIDSAGLEAKPSNRSPENAVLAAQDFGVYLENHIPKRIERNMFDGSAVVIAMETWHFRTLKKQFPEHKDKIFLLPLFEKNGDRRMRGFYRYNIEDPYGKELDEFRRCFRRIERCLEGLFREIEKR